MQIQMFRSLWGLRVDGSATLADRLAELRRDGFDGVEASLADIGFPSSTSTFMDAIAASGLAWICGVYSGWDDYAPDQWKRQTVAQHLAQYRKQLEITTQLPTRPIHINSHSGSDHFSDEEAEEFFAGALAIEAELNVTVSHETHRGRILSSPFRTERLLRAFPGLLITLDLSHWTLVSERTIPIDDPCLRLAIERTRHVHARVGTPQHAQLSDPHAKDQEAEAAAVTRYYDAVWKACAEQRRSRSAAVMTVTPEYGPVADGYMPPAIKSGGGWISTPDSHIDVVISGERDRLVRLLSNQE
ncbi:xylose isomerase-like protein [Zopfochytrium polystomum]|nr:xylose isomerase-like protein [Zopfochytrium polystomum]